MKGSIGPDNKLDKQEVNISLPATQKFELFNTLASWQIVENEIEQFLISSGVSIKVLKIFVLCVDELISNILKYAYSDSSSSSNAHLNVSMDENTASFADGSLHKIEMIINITYDKISLTLVDDGVPFDPNQRPKLEPRTVLEETPLGGLGIHLVKSLMDELTYRRVDNHNELTICKLREESK